MHACVCVCACVRACVCVLGEQRTYRPELNTALLLTMMFFKSKGPLRVKRED